MEEKFSQAVANSLKYYVYGLIDPRLNNPIEKIFYIGKGAGNRAFSHLESEAAPSEMSLKGDRIAEIRQAGQEPEITIIAHDLNEKDALRLEAQLIGIIDGLTNIAGGHYGRDFWLNARSIRERYGTPITVEQIEGPILFVNLNGGPNLAPYPQIADEPDELKRRTLGDWTISEKNSEQVRFIVGCYAQLARCVYRVDGHGFERLAPEKRHAKGRSRWRDGHRDLSYEDKIRERIIVNTDSRQFTKFGRTPWNLSV